MSYGSGWGGTPWGSGVSLFSSTAPVLYDIILEDSIDSPTTLAIVGLSQVPSIIVAAQSPFKVEVVFSVAMSIDSNFLDPANYSITRVEGSVPIGVVSVTASGPAPIRRATLDISADLTSKEYYFLTVSDLLISLTGHSAVPNFARFQWQDMTSPLYGRPLEILIKDFSGEGGIPGLPAGTVFFSPAFESVEDVSAIELESVSVCTKAYDEYHLPNPPDPAPLLTWRPGITTVLGAGNVLWAPATRLGLPSIDLNFLPGDVFQPANDFAIEAVLVEPIDITRAGFLNDARWKTFPATGATVFRTASNLTPIGPGPTTPVTLDWPKVVLLDSFPISDQVSVTV